MLVKVLSRFPKWQIDYLGDISKEKKVSKADLIRLSSYFFVLNYKGRYDKASIDRLQFEARKKIEEKKN